MAEGNARVSSNRNIARSVYRASATPILILLAFLLVDPAIAETTQDAEQFGPEFFTEASPQTALDMVRRLPGFTIDGGDKVRGLDGSVPNVLIDGQPVVSRSEGVNAILGRIPAAKVLRIEIYRSEAAGIELYGHPEVANVVRSGSAGRWAAIKLGSTIRNGYLSPQVNLDGELSKGLTSASGSLSYYRSKGVDTNGEIDYLDPTLRVIPGYALSSDFRSSGKSASMRFEFYPGEDISIKANASLSRSHSRTLVEAVPKDIVLAYTSISETDDEYQDLSLELTIGLDANTDLKSNLLYSFGTSGYSEDYLDASFSGMTDGTSNFSEAIANLTLDHRVNPRLSFQASVEGSLNRLDQSFRLFYGGQQFLLPFDELKIDEDRLLLTLRSVWSLNALSILAEAQWEASELRSAAEEGRRAASFSFFKPRLTLTYPLGSQTTIRLSGRRVVEQLDLSEFAATASVEFDNVNAGNGAIRPETAWQLSLELTRRFWKKGVFSLELVASDLQDVIDYTLGPDGFEIVGNIGKGHARRIEASLDLPLDRVGLKNVILRTEGTWHDSSVVDPVTGDTRSLSGESPFDGAISLIKDFPENRLTVKADLNFSRDTRRFRLKEATRFHKAPRIHLSAKYQPGKDVSLESTLDFAGGEDVSRRQRFDGTRSGALKDIEVRKSSPYVSIGLSLRISI